MISVGVQSLGDPGAFLLTDKEDPLYYMARYSHEMSLNLYQLSVTGFIWSQSTAVDVSGLEALWDTYSANFAAWAETAIAESTQGLPITNPPALPDIPNDSIEGILLHLALKAVIKIVTWWIQKKLRGDTEASEVAQILKRACLKNADTPQEFSILELLANTPLEILISRHGEYQDVVFSDRPET